MATLRGRAEPLTDAERTAIRARRSEGLTVPQIAAEFRCSDATVWVATKGMSGDRTEEFVAKVRELAATGMTNVAMAKAMGCSMGMLKRALHQGVGQYRNVTEDKKAECRKYLALGWGKQRIATHLQISRHTVRAVAEARPAGRHDPEAQRIRRERQREAAGAAHREGGDSPDDHQPALAPTSIRLALPEHVARMRDSLARHMPREAALREAMRVCAARGSHEQKNGTRAP